MENNATPIDIKSFDNFLLYLDNKQFILEISLNQGKINIQAVNNIGNNIINYESSYSYEDFMKINDYFKPCKETEKIYHFIIKLKNSKSLSLLNENNIINLCLHISEPIKDIIKIPLRKSELNNKAIILSYYYENKQLKEKIKNLEEKIDKNNELMKLRLIKRDIKGYSQNLLFIENEIEKQLKKNVINYDLLYKASRDGDKSENFHSKCDNINNTLVIIKTTNSNIFGGFTTKTWNNAGYINDPFAFAFSLNNQKIYNIIDNKNGNHAIYALSLYGPCFGDGTDFGLYSGCLEKNNNWCYCKNTYNFNGDHLNQNSISFQVLDYEVYHVILE